MAASTALPELRTLLTGRKVPSCEVLTPGGTPSAKDQAPEMDTTLAAVSQLLCCTETSPRGTCLPESTLSGVHLLQIRCREQQRMGLKGIGGVGERGQDGLLFLP